MADTSPCPLCGAPAPWRMALPGRPLHACSRCALHFVPASAHIPPAAELARYRLHQNSLNDAGYVRFLEPAQRALERHAPAGGRVLDYGAGPVPVLAELLRQAGFLVATYDRCFAPDTVLMPPFDAVVSTETFEHFRDPRADLDRIAGLLGEGGLLVVMTSLWTPACDFTRWHYATDTTHVLFYALETFRYIGACWGFTLVETNGRNLVVLRRGTLTSSRSACDGSGRA